MNKIVWKCTVLDPKFSTGRLPPLWFKITAVVLHTLSWCISINSVTTHSPHVSLGTSLFFFLLLVVSILQKHFVHAKSKNNTLKHPRSLSHTLCQPHPSGDTGPSMMETTWAWNLRSTQVCVELHQSEDLLSSRRPSSESPVTVVALPALPSDECVSLSPSAL